MSGTPEMDAAGYENNDVTNWFLEAEVARLLNERDALRARVEKAEADSAVLMHHLGEVVGGEWQGAHDVRVLKKENADLRAEVERLRAELKAIPKYNTTITVAPHIHHWVGDIPGELRCAGCGVVLKSED